MANGPVRNIPLDDRSTRGARAQRRRKQGGSGEGAASALESWREIERSRCACEPADEPAPSPERAAERRGFAGT